MTQGKRIFRVRPQLLLGIGCALLALVFNPWTLEAYVVLDGHLDNSRDVVIVELLLLAVGVWMVFRARKAPARAAGKSRRRFA